jgi:hypothetical protein
VRAEPLPVHRDAGPVGGRTTAGGEPIQRGVTVVIEVEAGPEHPGASGVGEGATAGDPRVEGRTAGRGAAEPLDEVVEPALLHLGQEGERHVELLGTCPAEGRGGPAYLQEGVEMLHRRRRRDQGDEETHHPIWVPSSDPMPYVTAIAKRPPSTLRSTARRRLL